MFLEALALIAFACLFGPLFQRLGLGSILGYLMAGVAASVSISFSFSEHPESLLHFAEFGVVLFMFIIGLELNPSLLWSMRRDIFGLGATQMLVSALVLAPLIWYALHLAGMGPDPGVVAVVTFGFALSSTAIVMQMLEVTGQRHTSFGRKAFAILLFQDIAIVPLLIMVSALAPGESAEATQPLLAVVRGIVAILLLVLCGRFLLDRLFSMLAASGAQEVMTASALGVVIAAGTIMDYAGMSFALGAFLAGVLLSESAFRHEIEANIEPFRGLFLALFFVAVGFSLRLDVVYDNALLIALLTPLSMLLKGLVLYAVARLFSVRPSDAIKVACALPQLGEFGFVLFSAAASAALLTNEDASILIAVVTCSMVLSPLAMQLQKMLLKTVSEEDIDEDYSDAGGRVLIIGFGRVGQVVSQPLLAQGIDITILDKSPDRVREAAAFGFRIHFGNGNRRDILKAAGADQVDLIIIAVDTREDARTILACIKEHWRETRVVVRSIDRTHSIELLKTGVDCAVRETFESSLRLGRRSLELLDVDSATAAAVIEDIRRLDRQRLDQQVEGDLKSGLERLHTRPARPAPLAPPQKQNKSLKPDSAHH